MFVQIGNLAINIDHIDAVKFKETTINIYTIGLEQVAWTLTEKDAEAFRQWWEEKVEVYVAINGNASNPVCPGCEAGTAFGHLQGCDKYILL